VCKMASYEIVSEIYKFRLGALEYDGLALAQSLRNKENGGGDKKKKDSDELVAPIPAKEKDRLARRVFVQRVQSIYTTCMNSEMSKGTSASHKTGGMDPQRLLLESDESQHSTREALQKHVAHRLYFITLREWALTAEVVRIASKGAGGNPLRALLLTLRRALGNLGRLLATAVYYLVLGLVLGVFTTGKCLQAMNGVLCATRSELDLDGDPHAGRRIRKGVGMRSEADDDANHPNVVKHERSLEERTVDVLKSNWQKAFGDPAKVMAEVAPAEEDEGVGARGERLDTTFIADEDAEEGGDAAAGGGGGGDGGGGGEGSRALKIKDDLLTTMSIDEYMYYRCRPMCTYFQRTAPWRAFELQCLEIIVFVFNSSGAALVGLSSQAVPYVALTVALANACKSFIEFSRLGKQVEAFNAAQRDLHNLINKWDGMTRTERRTRSTIMEVVGTVEKSMELVAVALTDVMPGQGLSDGGDDDGDDDDDS